MDAMDAILEFPNIELENGPIVVYINDQVEETNGQVAAVPAVKARKKPVRPRALVYDFFDWDEESSRYKCKNCKYVSS